MKCPEGSIFYCYILNRNVVAFLYIDYGRSRIKITRYVIPVFSFNKGIAVCVNFSLTAYGTAVRLIAVYKGKGGLTRNGISYKGCFEVVYSFARADIIFNFIQKPSKLMNIIKEYGMEEKKYDYRLDLLMSMQKN